MELFDELRGVKDESGSYPYENDVHDLIFPRFKSNDSIDYDAHNLWLIDDRLSFVNYISSDRTLDGGRRKKNEKVVDLLCYEDCGVWSADANISSGHLVLVELKRPGRKNYTSSDNPIQQVLDTLSYIRKTGSIKTESGKTIEVSEDTPAIVYIVADREKSFTEIIEDQDFIPTWDKKGYFKYHSRHKAYIEIATYDKIFTDALARNQEFLNRLFPKSESL